MQVILVRPWHSATVGGGCCSAAPDSVRLEPEPVADSSAPPLEHACHRPVDPVAQTYRLLRRSAPGVDVQMTTADNTLYLLPATYRAARRRHGRLEAVRRATRSTTAGAVIIDGEVAGDVATMGPDAILEKVLASDLS